MAEHRCGQKELLTDFQIRNFQQNCLLCDKSNLSANDCEWLDAQYVVGLRKLVTTKPICLVFELIPLFIS